MSSGTDAIACLVPISLDGGIEMEDDQPCSETLRCEFRELMYGRRRRKTYLGIYEDPYDSL
jgi:hypothetical protein